MYCNTEELAEMELDSNDMFLSKDFYYQELPPELSHFDKFDISYIDAEYDDDYQELFPWAFDMMEMLFEGYTTCTLLQNCCNCKLTDKEKKREDKLIRKMLNFHIHNMDVGFGKAYKRFLKAHDLPTQRVFVEECNISTITDGIDAPLLKTYFNSPEIVDIFWPKLYGFRDGSVIPPIHSEKELNDFLSLNKHDLYVYFHNYHAVFEVYFRKDLTTADELIERILPICDKHGKKLHVLL